MNKDLLWIKKYYSEQMAHLCRELFPTILECEGLLPKILDTNFAHSSFLYDDIIGSGKVEEFREFIYDLANDLNDEPLIEKEDNVLEPSELLASVGYDLYECKTEEDIQKFKKYYAPREELCTFHGGRLNSCYVFFAVKKEVDKIKREDFDNPERQDLYGTSVISIQFTRSNHIVSIKNRYNHTVDNPDATFGNNLDNIVPGLRKSFENKYGFNLENNKNDFELVNYVRAADNKFYKYNVEVGGVYYCPNNIMIKDFKPKKFSNRYILFDYFVLDLKNGKTSKKTNDSKTRKIKIKSYSDDAKGDAFIKSITDLGEATKIQYEKDCENNILIKIYIQDLDNPVLLKLDKFNNLISYTNEYIKDINNEFLEYNCHLREIYLPSVEKVGNSFLKNNSDLEKLNMPNVRYIGKSFLLSNDVLEKLYLPYLKQVEDYFLSFNKVISKIYAPRLEKVGDDFLKRNVVIKAIVFPMLKEINNDFLFDNWVIENMNIPNLEKVGSNFMYSNLSIKTINFPKLKKIGNAFFYQNYNLSSVNLPVVEKIRDKFLCGYSFYARDGIIKIKNISFPNLKTVGDDFCCNAGLIEKVDLPLLEHVGDNFLLYNRKLETISFPNLKTIGTDFLGENNDVSTVYLPEVEEIGNKFLTSNKVLTKISLPKVKEIGDLFLSQNMVINSIDLPEVVKIGDSFLYEIEEIKKVNFPKLELIGSNFLMRAKKIDKIELPSLEKVGNSFLSANNSLVEVSFPNLKNIGHYFIAWSEVLEKISLPKAKYIKDYFLANNMSLKEINLPLAEEIGVGFLRENENLEIINIPMANSIDTEFLENKKNLKSLICSKKLLTVINEEKQKTKEKENFIFVKTKQLV